MAFLDEVLQPPYYGWTDSAGNFSKPTPKMIFNELFSRLNIFKDKKNWLPFFSWMKVVCLVPFFILFVTQYFNFWLLGAAFLYSMVLMGTHGTIWYHRYCTHGAYTFKNEFWKFFTKNLMLSIIPEEIYVVSHHVHHAKSDTPGDPYFAKGGFLYCFLADVNHQPIAKDLSEKDYNHVLHLMKHTGLSGNDYKGYQKWGSFANPLTSVVNWVVNWGFWIGAFYLIGGMALVCALFGGALIWAVGVRTFNYDGHGQGNDMRKEGTDHNKNDMSINQIWPGYVAGEWHNNHHLYPKSARSGFLPHQLDLAWCYVKLMHTLGAVTNYRDSKKDFYDEYHTPYLEEKKAGKAASLKEKELV